MLEVKMMVKFNNNVISYLQLDAELVM